jgi:hypothetical protein
MDMVRRFVGDYSLSLALAGLFLFSWFIQTIAGWFMYAAEQHEHNQVATLFGESGYIWEWAEATFENWQSEFLQLFSFVVLAALYIHKGSAESKDGTEKLEASLRRIEQQLGTLPDTSRTQQQWQLPDTPLETEDAANEHHRRPVAMNGGGVSSAS